MKIIRSLFLNGRIFSTKNDCILSYSNNELRIYKDFKEIYSLFIDFEPNVLSLKDEVLIFNSNQNAKYILINTKTLENRLH